MAIRDVDDVARSCGYHPLVTDLADLLAGGRFNQGLVLGPGVPDVVDSLKELRQIADPSVQLPQGIYWYSGVDPAAVLLVSAGSAPSAPLREPVTGLQHDGPLAQALAWFEHLWPEATVVPPPAFSVLDEVLTRGPGEDGLIKSRQFVQGQWVYSVFVGGRTVKRAEASLVPRPTADSPHVWVASAPASADRFAATLTRAKLEGRFTDTVFSFRATRTIFRPYQFKPVMKLLSSGALRMLIADEVGLGKTIEAGLLWTELEARRQADRVLVVCPSALLAKWQREMDERFGFDLTELTSQSLRELKGRVEGGRLPRRATYVCTVERLRKWDGLADMTALHLQFDLIIVDEAHVFRNSDTKSHALGEQLSQWADALVFLSATPVNLRNQDLFNLLELLAPGEFQDLESLRERIEPNEVLHRVMASLLDPTVPNPDRRGWLNHLEDSAFGRVLMGRPEFRLLEETLAKPQLAPADVVQVRRVCSELHGLASQITRTRKVEVQEDRAVREPRTVPVLWSPAERDFYEAFYVWCVRRAQVKCMPLKFAMQMPLRLAGSCLPEAASYVLGWSRDADAEDEIDRQYRGGTRAGGPDIPPSPELVSMASQLHDDGKFVQFEQVVSDLLSQGKQTLVFTFSRRTLSYLETRLRGRCRVGLLHGEVPRDKRDQIMSDFRGGGYDILLATKVASEGLDFEFCSVLINYDLPWNPMEIEQRIGRIDRIGQREEKIIIVNFATPGTIESDILQRVLDRIGVFERAIGALEPIIDRVWSDIEDVLLDFTLTAAQRELKTQEVLAVIAEQERAVHDVESAAPYLISSDGVDIEGLEPDLLESGRYVGQAELALLVADWVKTYGGRAEADGDLLTITGNEELAGHVQTLVREGIRTSSEVRGVLTALRAEQPIFLSLDQEASRLGGTPLLTATHPLVRAALRVPGHRQTRFSILTMASSMAGVDPGTYLVHLCEAHWDGVRPLHEVWTATADARTGQLVQGLGDRVMAALAASELETANGGPSVDIQPCVSVTSDALSARQLMRERELQAENGAFMETRRLSAEQVHARRIQAINERIATLHARGRSHMVPLFEAQLRREHARYSDLTQGIAAQSHASLTTQDLAVCLVEVTNE